MADVSAIQSIIDTFLTPVSSDFQSTLIKREPGVESPQPSVILDDDVRPDHSYLDLITMALLSMPERQGTLHEIYNYISDSFPFYTKNRKHWKNSVRHNLALHKCFKRIDSTDADDILRQLEGRRPRGAPLWVLTSLEDVPQTKCYRRSLSKKNTPKRKKADSIETGDKPLKKPRRRPSKLESVLPPPSPRPYKPSTVNYLTKIARMLPDISSAPTTTRLSLNQGLIQPPHTPESDYGSLSSDLSPNIPGQCLSAKSTTSSVFDYSSLNTSTQDANPSSQVRSLPLLSVDDICAVLQCDDCLPGSPDSGTGGDILDGFGWFEGPVPVPNKPVYEHQQQRNPDPPCFADSLLGDWQDNYPINQRQAPGHFQPIHFQQEPPAISFLVPKVPVTKSLLVNTNFTW